jgi:hypothetical protein
LRILNYNILYIGNYKQIIENDPIKEIFNETISYFKTCIWGLGWHLDKNLYHGQASLSDVSKI